SDCEVLERWKYTSRKDFVELTDSYWNRSLLMSQHFLLESIWSVQSQLQNVTKCIPPTITTTWSIWDPVTYSPGLFSFRDYTSNIRGPYCMRAFAAFEGETLDSGAKSKQVAGAANLSLKIHHYPNSRT